jgi:hypothetical protein
MALFMADHNVEPNIRSVSPGALDPAQRDRWKLPVPAKARKLVSIAHVPSSRNHSGTLDMTAAAWRGTLILPLHDRADSRDGWLTFSGRTGQGDASGAGSSPSLRLAAKKRSLVRGRMKTWKNGPCTGSSVTSQWHILGDKPVSVTLTTAPACRFDSQNLHWNMLIDIKDVAALWRSSAEAFCHY